MSITSFIKNNLILVVVGSLIVAAAIAALIYTNVRTKESFVGMPVVTPQIERVQVSNDGTETLLSTQCGQNSTSFVSVPSFQSMLSPRIQPTPFSAFIKYRPTQQENLAVPENPLGYGKSVTEAFMGTSEGSTKCVQCGSTCGDTCSLSGMTSDNMQRGGINNYTATDMNSPIKQVTTDSLPVGTMTTLSSDGSDPEQSIVYDRLVYANKKNRLLSHGDMIRGDLAIQQNCNQDGWFQSAWGKNPSQVLQLGYMRSIAGAVEPTDTEQMMQLLGKTTGNTSLIGGYGSNNSISSIGSSGDVVATMTAFP